MIKWKFYWTQDNYNSKYIFVVSENSLLKVEASNFQMDKLWYEIFNVKAQKVLLGDSHVNEIIDFSGAPNHQDGKKTTSHLNYTPVFRWKWVYVYMRWKF